MYVGEDGSSFSAKLLKYLQKVDYRIARDEEELEAIFRLRHKAYVAEEIIEPKPSGVFHDAYDEMPNCYNFGVYIDERLVSAVRCNLTSPEHPMGHAYDFYPDAVRPLVEEGQILVDPTRFVADKAASLAYPELPYLTLRAACMTYDHFDADLCLASVREEHQAFYRRVFRAEVLTEPRPNPPLTVRFGLMATNVASFRDKLLRRYPIFESSFTERKLLFGGGGGPLRHRLVAQENQVSALELN